MSVVNVLKKQILILDGAMGTEIIRHNINTSFSEILNLENSKLIYKIHSSYINAGADIIETNTFGANRIKLASSGKSYPIKDINIAGAQIARKAAGSSHFVAGSIGPLGKLIKPLGELTVEDAYEAFKEQAVSLEEGGVDFLLIETQIDILEAKTALRAAKENTKLPVVVSMSFTEDGRTVSGTDPETAAVILNAAGADIIGTNCGKSPDEFIKFVEIIRKTTEKPIIVYPNAGIPEKYNGKVIYPAVPKEMAKYAENFYKLGANIIGGCCGNTPSHITLIAKRLKHKKPLSLYTPKNYFEIASRVKTIRGGSGLPFLAVGENINPFGKKGLSKEIKEGRIEYIKKLAIMQESNGADALDINLGKKGEKDPLFYKDVVEGVQSVVNLPLFFDVSNPVSLKSTLSIHPGKAVINSVNGNPESMETLLPLAKRYGAGIVILALDERGIPDKAKARFKIIEKVYKQAIKYGLSERDIIVDGVVLTISAKQDAALETLKTLKMVKELLGLSTILGISNISFGLPARPLLNKAFLNMALSYGLDAGILNPLNKDVPDDSFAMDAITGKDKNLKRYIERFRKVNITYKEEMEEKPASDKERLYRAVKEGMEDEAYSLTTKLINQRNAPMDILNNILIPALKEVGDLYEKKVFFLPQLLTSSRAVQRATDLIRKNLKTKKTGIKRGKILFATVKGDYHDIGKNIVLSVLKSYGYEVIDLGKDKGYEEIIEKAKKEKIDIIGLSALMTTTMEEMEYIVKRLKREHPHFKVLVGGAAVSRKFAEEIGADAYARDAMGTVKVIEKMSKGVNG